MKTAFTTILLLLVICTVSANTDLTQQCHRNNINLHGYYDPSEDNHTQTRNLPILPIQAFIDGTILYLKFSTFISELNITLINHDIEVESKTLTAKAGQYEIIDLSEYEPSTYMIILSTAQGNYLKGEFIYNE